MRAYAKIFLSLQVWWAVTFAAIVQPTAQERVDLNLVLAIDCSYSVDASEFQLQINGLAAAFANSQIIDAITHGQYRRISVALVQWSGPKSQIITVPWTVISGPLEAYKFALEIKSQKRQSTEGATSISAMISKAVTMLASAPYRAERQVIDIAADGENNSGERVERVRDRTLDSGITINALAILNEVSYLNYYFQNRVIGGPGAFVQIAKDYNDFGRAIRRKLLREISGTGIF